ncbi:MAG: hypothetical protein AAF611_06720 [Bacteroidota bacterium]
MKKIIKRIRRLSRKKSVGETKKFYFSSWKSQEEFSKRHLKELKKIKEKIKNLNH